MKRLIYFLSLISCILLVSCKYKKIEDDTIDLTIISSTMVYSQVNQIVSNPTDYLNKTIKAKGYYQSNYLASTDNYYHFIIIADALGCCKQGLEFIWSGEHNYPDDYPPLGEEIIIQGIYSSYVELNIIYYCIMIDEIEY